MTIIKTKAYLIALSKYALIDIGDTFYLLENGQVKALDSGKGSLIQEDSMSFKHPPGQRLDASSAMVFWCYGVIVWTRKPQHRSTIAL
ncbi:MAG TPA: hypothetical protein DD671_04530 [Balneolaceae bacterium]|nr:hypothetical protein [Balneolaceae bacterium]